MNQEHPRRAEFYYLKPFEVPPGWIEIKEHPGQDLVGQDVLIMDNEGNFEIITVESVGLHHVYSIDFPNQKQRWGGLWLLCPPTKWKVFRKANNAVELAKELLKLKKGVCS